MPRGTASYSEAEVQALVTEYAALVEAADTTRPGLRALVELADLHVAFQQVPLEYAAAIFWHGIVGMSQECAAQQLQISQQAVSKRYRLGLEELHYLMNGGE